MSGDVAVSKQERAQRWIDDALEQLPERVICQGCGEVVGRYRPGRVAVPSLQRPSVPFKCIRSGCRTVTVVVLSETID